MRGLALIAVLAAGCVTDRLYVSGIHGTSYMAFSGGIATSLGDGCYVTPRHCFPAGTSEVRTAWQTMPVTELASGLQRKAETLQEVARDWVIFRVPGNARPPLVPMQVRLAVGDEVRVADCTLKVLGVNVEDEQGVLAPGIIATELGPAVPGWSGLPVVWRDVTIGIVHGSASGMLIVTLLPR